MADTSPGLTQPNAIVPPADEVAGILAENVLQQKGHGGGVRISNFPVAISRTTHASTFTGKPGESIPEPASTAKDRLAEQEGFAAGEDPRIERVRTPVDADRQRWTLTDLDFRETSDRFAVERPVVKTSLPRRAGGLTRIGSLGVRLASEDSASVGTLSAQSVVYPNVARDVDLVARATGIGFAVGWSIRSADAGREVRVPLDLPEGIHAAVMGTGEVQLLDRAGRLFGNVSVATAHDANKVSVPVKTSVQDDTIVYRVAHEEGAVAYPVNLDPTVSIDWRTTPPNASDGWFSFSTPYGTNPPQPFLYSRNTQSSTQQGGLAIGAPPSAAYALDATGAWTRFAPGNPDVGTLQAGGRKVSPEHAWWYRIDAGAVNYLTLPTQWYHAYNNPYGAIGILNRDGAGMASQWQPQTSGTGPTNASYGPAQAGIPTYAAAVNGAGASVWIGSANTGAGVNASDATDNAITMALQQPKFFYQNDHPATSLAMGWYSAYAADGVAPVVNATSPTEWQGLTYTIPVSATDNGLGIKSFQLRAADNVPIGAPTTEPCSTPTASKICEFSDSADVPIEPAQEGIHPFKVAATDAGGRVGTKDITLKVDKTAPELNLTGSAFDDQATNLPANQTRTLTINAADGVPNGTPEQQRSGVRYISVWVDGELVAGAENTEAQRADNQPLSLTVTFKGGTVDTGGDQSDDTESDDSAPILSGVEPSIWDDDLSEDISPDPDEILLSPRQHTIEVTASDWLGHEHDAAFNSGQD